MKMDRVCWFLVAVFGLVLSLQVVSMANCADDECHGTPAACPTGCIQEEVSQFNCCCTTSDPEGGCCQYYCLFRKCWYQIEPFPIACATASVTSVTVGTWGWPGNQMYDKTCQDPPGTCE